MNCTFSLASIAAVAGLIGSLLAPAVASAQQAEQPPAAPREFRGSWIPSVYNLGWPSKPGLPSQVQQQELITLLDEAKALNLNAILLQVRPSGDALYNTKLAPWSEFLTGEQGRPPQPYYDPLEFAVTEAHRRGIQLHAWINPYRAATRQGGTFAESSPVRTLAGAAKKIDKLIWLDPAEPAVRDHVLAVVQELVSRYDIDGIHIDDYFYPYSSEMKGTNGDFPDQDSWAKYQASGGKMSRGDWRRSHVDELMSRIYATMKQIKPRCYFSTAPFGIWRPGYPEGISGLDSYESLYGDSRKWLREGWLDFTSPQLYWDLSKEKQSFPKLLAWWNSENVKGRHVWPGMSVSGAGGSFPTSDIIKRIQIVRDQEGAKAGNVLWSFATLHANKTDLVQLLKKGPYATPALIPPSPWMDNQPPAPPAAVVNRDIETGGVSLQWSQPSEADAFLIGIYAKVNGQWLFTSIPIGAKAYRFAGNAIPTAVVVSAVDRTGNESQRVPLSLTGGKSVSIPSPVTAPPLPGRR
jgi:uncharacterized lipoprotein YddW (UPF0748 family)